MNTTHPQPGPRNAAVLRADAARLAAKARMAVSLPGIEAAEARISAEVQQDAIERQLRAQHQPTKE